MQTSYPIYNCHIHTFNNESVPDNYYPEWMMKTLKSKPVKKLLDDLANDRKPVWEIMEQLGNIILKITDTFGEEEEIEDYVQFLVYSNMSSQRKIFEECIKGYPEDARFIVLSMDMAYMNRGDVPQDYKVQLEELRDLSHAYPGRVYPFVHIDPRRPECKKILDYAFNSLNFKGVKLYPPLGVYPFDKKLDYVYNYCSEKGIPVLAHCSPHNPVRYKVHNAILHPIKHKKDMDQLRGFALKNPYASVNLKGLDHKELCDLFTHPKNYAHVCEKYPSVRICLAHFGSAREWEKFLTDKKDPENWVNIITNMVKKYDNLYTDISYLMYFKKYHKALKKMLDEDEKLRKKVLFGSDFYMPMGKMKDLDYVESLEKGIGPDNFRIIAHDNPIVYLGQMI